MKYPGSSGGISSSNFITVECDSNVSVNDVIYIDPSDSIAKKAIANDWIKTQVAGFVFKKKTSTTCIVQISGKIKLTGLSISQNYFLSDSIPGTIQLNPPTSNYIKRLGRSLINNFFIIELGTIEGKRI
jgi:hypothetical protein